MSFTVHKILKYNSVIAVSKVLKYDILSPRFKISLGESLPKNKSFIWTLNADILKTIDARKISYTILKLTF